MWKKTILITHLYLKVDLNQEIWEELYTWVTTLIIWFSSMTIRPLIIPSGFTFESQTRKRIFGTNSISLIWSSPTVLITKAKNLSCTLQETQTDLVVMAGIEMAKISVTTKIQWKERAVAFTIRLHLRQWWNTMTMKFLFLTATRILILIAVNYCSSCVEMKLKIR